jgi:hypothetical protein
MRRQSHVAQRGGRGVGLCGGLSVGALGKLGHEALDQQ